MWKQALAGLALSIATITAAAADIPATAIADLNIRSGPGPQFPATGVIRANATVAVSGFIQGSLWCTVNTGTATGWAYSAYLTTAYSGAQVALAQPPTGLAVPQATYSGPIPPALVPGGTGPAPLASAGTIINAPIAVQPGVTPGFIGGVQPAVPLPAPAPVVIQPLQTPPPTVQTYVASNPVPQVYLNGEVVVGATIPQTVAVTPVPSYQYDYLYVNGLGVLVDPVTRQIVYIFR